MLVLVHSPIVGRFTWALAAQELERRGIEVLVPALRDSDASEQPYWEQHARSVAEGCPALPQEGAVLVAHSGAGPLLPAIGQRLGRPAAYVFVDASLPEHNQSRLGQLTAELPMAGAALRNALASGQAAPRWSDADLREEIPDARCRRGVLAELRPHPARFYEEPIPVFEGWPDAPCGYLQFSQAYDTPGAKARELGWPYRRLEGGHFQLLVDPPAVAGALLDMVSAVES